MGGGGKSPAAARMATEYVQKYVQKCEQKCKHESAAHLALMDLKDGLQDYTAKRRVTLERKYSWLDRVISGLAYTLWLISKQMDKVWIFRKRGD